MPDVICVCEMWLTNQRLFVGKLHWYDFVNKLSNSNQSGGVSVFVRALQLLLGCRRCTLWTVLSRWYVEFIHNFIKLRNNKYF